MSGNGTRAIGLILLGSMALGALSGCGKGKEQAVVALEEARLNIASAKKSGAEARAGGMLRDAQSVLMQAEGSFKAGDFGASKEAAARASNIAKMAEASSKSKPAVKRTFKPTAKGK